MFDNPTNLKIFKDTCIDLALSEIVVRVEGEVKFTPVDKIYMLSNRLGIAFFEFRKEHDWFC